MINFIILGAGKGTRMNSNIPKVLHKMGDRTMLQISVDLCKKFAGDLDKIVVVVSPEIAENFTHLLPKNVDYAIQDQQLGTAHAVKSAIPKIDQGNDYTIVLYGDHQLLRLKTVEKMVEILKTYSGVVLGFIVDEENKYGKLMTKQDQSNINIGEILDLLKIKEAKEFLSNELQPRLCNSGLLGFKTADLLDNIEKINNNNASDEYYLTDIISLINNQDVEKSRSACLIVESEEVLGVNTQDELKIAEKILLSRNEA